MHLLAKRVLIYRGVPHTHTHTLNSGNLKILYVKQLHFPETMNFHSCAYCLPIYSPSLSPSLCLSLSLSVSVSLSVSLSVSPLSLSLSLSLLI